MLALSQAIILGALQGVTELFPISSLGHTVILPRLLGWNIDQHDPSFLSFIIATHFATALVLLGFFWSDWVKILRGIFRSLAQRMIAPSDTYARLGWLLIVTTIPAGILGLLFEDRLKELFASPRPAALFLFLNGLLLLGAELLRRRGPKSDTHDDSRIAALTWMQSTKIGLLQCLALLPGFSRTGATLAGGLLQGLSHKDAARFSFLLATPIIFAAAALKLPELLSSSSTVSSLPMVIGSLSSGIAAYFSIRFLSRYFKSRTLVPFALYCLVAGLLSYGILR